jgi:hypothetical protein
MLSNTSGQVTISRIEALKRTVPDVVNHCMIHKFLPMWNVIVSYIRLAVFVRFNKVGREGT